MKEIYRKTSMVLFIGGSLAAVYAIIYYFIWFEGFSVNGDKLLGIVFLAVMLIGSGFYFTSTQKNLGDETLSESENTSVMDFENIHELNMQWVPSFYPKMYHVNPDGQPLIKVEPSMRRPFLRKLTCIKLFSEGFYIPASYDILNMKDELLATFTVWNNGNRFVLTLYDANNKKIGFFEQWLTKSVLKNRGTLYGKNDTIWRELLANNMAGDIDIKDNKGKTAATYRYGLFPYALNPAFQAEALHSHVRFGADIPVNEKLAYTMIFFFWLKK